MRGNVCIELHNHRTGFKERIEGHNDITDALQTAINYGVFFDKMDRGAPVVSTLLGGVMLFDKQLSGSDIMPPGDAHIVGSGFQGLNTESNLVGTYNYIESGISRSQKIYTHVWDFSTSQAIGTIRSLGLTTSDGGQYPNALRQYYQLPYSHSYFDIVYVDETNNDVYYVDTNESPLPLKKAHYNFQDIMLHTTSSLTQLNGEDTGITFDNTGRRFTYGHDGYLYRVYRVNNSVVTIFRYRVSDLSFASSQLTLDFTGAVDDIPSSSNVNIAVYDGYLYMLSKNNRYIYKYDLDNDTYTAIKISDTSGSYIFQQVVCGVNGDIYVCGNSGTGDAVRVTSDGIVSHHPISTGITMGTIYDSGIMSSNKSIGLPSCLLMTNYNLPTPVEKTALTSMKVLYTLTQD